ncbi:glycosyltransferase [Metapseudomonas resinovorans]|uniref:Glycosyltransferase 2-like domain-containing protein n=1 Tax=Metapseudomonas resinovorans NBRC 106553 TaxID=1245471 RepID=S6AX27_METRE|nr:glycosyltransferase [Pseudomonas resinovorans]BAN50958.1 hypothetical protein PCA10_52260 [Pseudomonas resinovorans NBRC 106553]
MTQVTSPQSVEHKVSVIIPCYNYGRFLEQTIESLRGQSYQNWEAIIVDDGSTDDSEEVAERLVVADPRVRYVHQPNAGTSAAKNAGIRLAQGDYLLFLDADDLIMPAKLMAHVRHFKENPHVDISYSRFRYFEDLRANRLFTKLDLTSTEEWSKVIDGRYEAAFPVFVRGNNMAIHAAVVRKSLIEKVGYFDVGMRALEDWDYWLRCILRGAHISFLDDPQAIALTRVHPASATQKLDFSSYIETIYEKVAQEAARIRAEGDERFYGFVMREMELLEKKNRNRSFKRKKSEIQARIRLAGFLDGGELLRIARDFGYLNCARAYFGALTKHNIKDK